MTAKNLENATFFTHTFSPPCRFVEMVLRSLNLNCKRQIVEFASPESKSPEYLAVNPCGKVPGFKDGNFCLGESRAIAAYLCNKYAGDSPLYPADPAARARVDQLLSIDTGMIEACYAYTKPFQVLFLKQKPETYDDKAIKTFFAVYEGFLSATKYLAGDQMTLADLSAINAFSVLDLCNYSDYGEFPKLKAWMDGMKKLPFFDECSGIPNKEVIELYQTSLKK